jgi:hypothetical protein
MDDQYESLTESLNSRNPVYQSAHNYIDQIHREGNRYIERTLGHIQSDTKRHLDTNEIDHGLNTQDLRTLLKIIAKDLPDCGRKRGAILRYIKAYTPEPNNDNRKLYQILNETQT